MKNWQARFLFISAGLLITLMCLFFVFKVFNENLIFFYTPTELVSKNVSPGPNTIKIGGYVVENSIEKISVNSIKFIVTDFENNLEVFFTGMVPALFKEGQGTIATGRLEADGVFKATQILAKHDENYVPAEIANTLKEQGLWQN